MFEDDDSHPIPSVNNLDMIAQRRTGGADLLILVPTPLEADERSQRRLVQKIENYLGFIVSSEFKQEFGAPDPSTVRIVVKINNDSDPAVFALLKRCEPWVNDNQVSLVVEAPAAQSQ
jgi:hypothetical protein